MPLKKIAFGKKETGNSISKFRGVENLPSIISIIDKDGLFAVPLHYVNGLGWFHCFEGACCSSLGAPKIKYVIPVVNYRIRNIETRELNLDLGAEVQYMSIGEDTYEKLIKLSDQCGGDIDDIDIFVTTLNETFSRFDLDIIIDSNTGKHRPASWKKNETVRNSVLAYYRTTYSSKISISLGRELTSSEFIKFRNENNGIKNQSNSSYSQPEQANSPQIPPPPPMVEDQEFGEELTEADIEELLT